MVAANVRKKILVVDDEPGVMRVLEAGLRQEGYDVVAASSGPDALAYLHVNEPDLVVLDILMPEMDGFEVCQRIRHVSSVPIIMLTALRREDDIVRGLDAGADEYVTKPFGIAELVARVRAALRRVELERLAVPAERILTVDDGRLIIDLDRRLATRDGEHIPLSDTEFRLLAFLIANVGRVVPHEKILENVWGRDHTLQTAYLRTYIGLLRRKIEADPQSPRLIISSHGVGYRFQEA
ncbi:MAG: response regulator transcription factor [Chloroflexi bacterium]|nr:response regulator transcription factor [Chloroflexota bacterium]